MCVCVCVCVRTRVCMYMKGGVWNGKEQTSYTKQKKIHLAFMKKPQQMKTNEK